MCVLPVALLSHIACSKHDFAKKKNSQLYCLPGGKAVGVGGATLFPNIPIYKLHSIFNLVHST